MTIKSQEYFLYKKNEIFIRRIKGNLHMTDQLNAIYERIGRNLYTLRTHYGKTQEELCDYLGKTQTTISKYESGTTRMNLETIMQICHFFSISLHDLLETDINPNLFIKKQPIPTFSLTDVEMQCLSDKLLYLYFVHTESEEILETNLLFGEIPKNGNDIYFTCEMNIDLYPKQLYDGELIIGIENYYFIIKDCFKNERVIIITYRYPHRDRIGHFCLLGLYTALSYKRDRPCVRKCILSAKRLNINDPKLFYFLRFESENEMELNTSYFKHLRKQSDTELFEWIKKEPQWN